jgi:hypothetical protein
MAYAGDLKSCDAASWDNVGRLNVTIFSDAQSGKGQLNVMP